jgi:prepilin-type N-terminal cleavage/methylation domain-containing protein
MRTRSGQAGFTLLELLVVVAVLGALSGVAVVGVNAFDEQAQSSVCAADARTIATAQEAALLGGGAYLDEDGLVKAGYLRDASTLHDITVAGELYSLTPVDACVDLDGAELASAELADDVDEEKVKEAERAAAERTAEENKAAEKQKAEQSAAAEKAAAEKAAAEDAAKKKAEEEAEAKKKAEEQAEAKKKTAEEEAEAKKKADEAEAKKKADEAEKDDAAVPPKRPERPQNRVDGKPRR